MITSKCRRCKFVFASRIFQVPEGANWSNVAFAGNSESCVRCGGRADTLSGGFDIKDGVITNFVSINSDPELVRKFLAVAKKAQAGEITREQAAEQIESLGLVFSEVWKILGNNGVQISLLIALASLAVTVYFGVASYRAVVSSEELERRQTEALETIREEIRRLPEPVSIESGAARPPSGDIV